MGGLLLAVIVLGLGLVVIVGVAAPWAAGLLGVVGRADRTGGRLLFLLSVIGGFLLVAVVVVVPMGRRIMALSCKVG
jgi:hypothetical protein